jgi:hypothetical protein
LEQLKLVKTFNKAGKRAEKEKQPLTNVFSKAGLDNVPLTISGCICKKQDGFRNLL